MAPYLRPNFSRVLNHFQIYILHSSHFALILNHFIKTQRRDTICVAERNFYPANMVKIRLKSLQPLPSKFKSEWSGPYQVVQVRNVKVKVKKVFTGREYNTHHDRHFYPILSRNFAFSLAFD